jgi:FtsP/CotA-like multicopper oxidase with cupredoxin domain
MISRRTLLGAAAGLAATRFAMAQTADGATVLRAMRLDGQVLNEGEPTTALWSYGPSWPQSVITAKQGEEMAVRIVNELDRELALHWHGIRGPAAMMNVKIAPGEANAVECRFTPPDAGTFWLRRARADP